MGFKSKVVGAKAPNQVHALGGHKDRFGRAIEAQISLYMVEVIEGEKPWPGQKAERSLWYPNEPGLYHAIHAIALRGGEAYGAYQGPKHFKSEAERSAYLAKYLKQAERAAAKRAGK